MAIGMTYVIIAGGFDLSLTAGFSFCAVVAALVGIDYPTGVAFLAAILAGGFIGLANAVLIARFDVNPFITTVGTGFMVTGATFVLTGNPPTMMMFITSNRMLGSMLACAEESCEAEMKPAAPVSTPSST